MKVFSIQTEKGQILIGNGENEDALSKRAHQDKLVRELLLKAGISPDLLRHKASGQAYIANHTHHLSLSHSGNYAALYLSQEAVGVDIQFMGKDLRRGRSYFTNPTEEKFTKNEDLYLIWGAKEAIYKLYEGGFNDAANEISVHQIDRLQSVIHADVKGHAICCSFFEFPEYCLVFV